MSSLEPPKPLDSPALQNPSISSETEEKSLEKETPESKEDSPAGNGETVEEEEEGECGFCLFMKGGGCKDTFTEWEKCIDEAEKNSEDIVEKCFQATAALKKCMEAHSDYYEPILRAEKAAEEEVVRELQKEEEAASKDSDVNSGLMDPEQKIKEAGDSS